MYSKDKTETLHIRMSKSQIDYLNNLAKITGVSKTEIIRGYVDKLIGSSKLANIKTH